ncbi:MAG: hypothetical protein ABR616_18265 [Dermatophilaceae bacterium]
MRLTNDGMSLTGSIPPRQPEPTFDEKIASMTVAEVLAGIAAGDLDPDLVLASEINGRERTGILDAITAD